MNISWLQFPFSVKWSSPSKSDSQMGPPRVLVQHAGRFIKLSLIRYFHTQPLPHTDGWNMLCCSLGVLAPAKIIFFGEGLNLPWQSPSVACHLGSAGCQQVSALLFFLFTFLIYFPFPFCSSYRRCCLPLGISGLQVLKVISGIACDLHPSKTNFLG